MEQCVYCEKPLFETERVRWYGERVHSECYDALLATDLVIIMTEPLTDDDSQDMTSAFSEAIALQHA